MTLRAEARQAPCLVTLETHADARGQLVVGEVPAGLPFRPKRFFVVSGVPEGASHAEHAHRKGEQLLCCVHGSCAVDVATLSGEVTFELDRPTLALHLPPLHWVRCRNFSPEAILLVLASHEYVATELVSDRAEAIALLRHAGAPIV